MFFFHHQWCSTLLWMTSARAPCSTSSCGRVCSSARASRCVSTVRSGTPRPAALAQGYVLNLRQGFDDSRITENNPNSTAKPWKNRKNSSVLHRSITQSAPEDSDVIRLSLSSSWICFPPPFTLAHKRLSSLLTKLVIDAGTHPHTHTAPRWRNELTQKPCQNLKSQMWGICMTDVCRYLTHLFHYHLLNLCVSSSTNTLTCTHSDRWCLKWCHSSFIPAEQFPGVGDALLLDLQLNQLTRTQ